MANIQIVAQGGGNVVGPSSSTDNAIARFDLAGGKLLQNSAVIVSDAGNVKIPSTAPNGVLVYKTADEVTDVKRLNVGESFGGSLLIWSEGYGSQSPLSLDIAAYKDSSTSSSHIRINPSDDAVSPSVQLFHTNVSTERYEGVFHLYSAHGSELRQTAGDNRFTLVEARYNQSASTANNIDLGVLRRGVNFGSGTQRLLSLLTSPSLADDVPTEQFGIDPSGVVQVLKVASIPPASASATGQAGTITWDSSFIYVCVATNTWKRAAISTW